MGHGMALPRASRLLRRGRPRRSRPIGRGRAAEAAALAAGGVRFLLAPSAARLLPAAGLLVDGGPGPPLRLPGGDAALLVPLGDVLGLALLLAGVGGLVSTWHVCSFHPSAGRQWLWRH